ncbi:MAG: hypothetical protein R6X14_03710 [bacterium]
MAVAGSRTDVLYAGGYIGSAGAVARSTDRGLSWQQTAAAPAETVFGLAVDPADADRVFAATSGGAYRSSDAGASWTRVSSERGSRAVAFHPGAPDTIVIGGSAGVWVSRDRGQNWQAMSDGLAGQSVTCLAFAVDDAVRLYAGTARGAAYRFSFATGVAEGARGERPIDRPGLPTFVRGSLVLPCSPGISGLALFSAVGLRVMELHDGANDVRCLSPGVYFIGETGAAGRTGFAVQKVVIQP